MVSKVGLLEDSFKPAARDDAIVIDTLRPGDLQAVITLDARITGTRKPDVWRGFSKAFGADQLIFLVARGADGLAGYAVGGIREWEFGSPPAGWIFAVGVAPEQREGGVGSRLFDAMSKRFAAAKVRSVRTMLHVDDHLLMSFFRSQGMMAGPYVELEMPFDQNA
jgi:ribosomal protein S18 acetylase RimI-like enzyme